MSSRWKARYAKKRCTPWRADPADGRAGEAVADAVKIEAAPTHLLNEKVDVPMMLRVVEREAQTLSQKKQTFTFEIDTASKCLATKISYAVRFRTWSITP